EEGAVSPQGGDGTRAHERVVRGAEHRRGVAYRGTEERRAVDGEREDAVQALEVAAHLGLGSGVAEADSLPRVGDLGVEEARELGPARERGAAERIVADRLDRGELRVGLHPRRRIELAP